MKYGDHLRVPSASAVTITGGYDPNVRAGWMWDLTVQTAHDFYIQTATTAVLVHNCPVEPRDVHGADRSGRGVDVQNVLQNGDLYYQEDGQLVRVLDNGNGTSDVVIRDPSNPSGAPTTTINNMPNSQVQARIDSGRWGD